MKKNLTALLLAFSLCLSLAACGAKEEAPAASSTPAASTEEPNVSLPEVDPDADQPAASTEGPVEDVMPQVPAEPEVPAEPGSEGPSEPVVQPEPIPEPVPETPVQSAGESVDLNAFYEALAVSGGENWPAMMGASDTETLSAFYPGIEGIATKQAAVYMPMMSAVAAEFMLVEVENEADVQAVKDILNARVSYQVGDEVNPGGAWYPETIESWKTNSRVVSNGRYVMLAVFPENVDGIVEQFNALFA